MIVNVAKSYARKVFEYSESRFHKDNRTRIKNILIKNNFPVREIERIINLTSMPVTT